MSHFLGGAKGQVHASAQVMNDSFLGQDLGAGEYMESDHFDPR